MKIIVTGPESSGKSTLACAISRQLNLPLVEEYARTYISTLTKPYTRSDVEHIAKTQIEERSLYSDKVAVYDTDLLTSIIWYEEKYCAIPEWMLDQWRVPENSFYLLCTPDVPWEYDIQRENPHDRMRLFEIYHDYLTTFHKEFFIISDDFNNRLKNAIKMIDIKIKVEG